MTGKYEYKVVSWDIYLEISLQDFINKYANDGWELVTATGSTEFQTLTFRREK